MNKIISSLNMQSRTPTLTEKFINNILSYKLRRYRPPSWILHKPAGIKI